MSAEQDAGRDEREEVVRDAIGEERAEDRRRREMGTQRHEDHALEHPEAAGQVAREPGDLRREECREEPGEAERRRSGEERPEDARGERPVERRERELREREPERRNADLDVAPTERRSSHGAPADVSRDERDAGDAEGRLGAGRPGGYGERCPRLQKERRAGQKEEAEPERDPVERDDGRDVGRPEAPRRIEAIANRATAEKRRPDVVTERVPDERRERDLRIPQRQRQIATGERVVPRQQPVARRRQHHPEGQPPRRNPAQRPRHLPIRVLPQLVMQQSQRPGEEQDAECRRDVRPERPSDAREARRPSRRRLRRPHVRRMAPVRDRVKHGRGQARDAIRWSLRTRRHGRAEYGTAEGAGLGDERRTESALARRRSPYEPHAPITEARTMSLDARGAPTTRESAAGDRSRPILRALAPPPRFEVTHHSATTRPRC